MHTYKCLLEIPIKQQKYAYKELKYTYKQLKHIQTFEIYIQKAEIWIQTNKKSAHERAEMCTQKNLFLLKKYARERAVLSWMICSLGVTESHHNKRTWQAEQTLLCVQESPGETGHDCLVWTRAGRLGAGADHVMALRESGSGQSAEYFDHI